jgi:hypothetical protein
MARSISQIQEAARAMSRRWSRPPGAPKQWPQSLLLSHEDRLDLLLDEESAAATPLHDVDDPFGASHPSLNIPERTRPLPPAAASTLPSNEARRSTTPSAAPSPLPVRPAPMGHSTTQPTAPASSTANPRAWSSHDPRDESGTHPNARQSPQVSGRGGVVALPQEARPASAPRVKSDEAAAPPASNLPTSTPRPVRTPTKAGLLESQLGAPVSDDPARR